MDRVDQRGFDNQRSELVSAKEAARYLGVRLATLYSYASRGLVRSEPGPKGRGRRYQRADLERLKQRSEARSGHAPVAAGALSWGEPVLETAVSAIREDGPSYRGVSAVKLARDGVRFESAAELLFTGTLPDEPPEWSASGVASLVREVRRSVPPGPPLPTLLAAVPRLALADPDRHAAPVAADLDRGRRLIRTLVAILGLSRGEDAALAAAREPSIAGATAIALGVSARKTRAALDRTLVLTADHELNASTFAARVVASTGADVYACVTGALAALSGPRHGAFSDRVEALLDEVAVPERAAEVVAARTARGEVVPGFGHPLYPAGDPRVAPMLEAALPLAGQNPRVKSLLAIIQAMERGRREPPNLDFGLVVVVHALGLPRGSGAALFALGRTAGWIAHALEQRETGRLLRPRATYVGK
ncbi:MAG TPA: citrate synthase family protein [Polyangiaceae bacterium]|nr:citrate synthase family protein [Polyangiaceae bacterium]